MKKVKALFLFAVCVLLVSCTGQIPEYSVVAPYAEEETAVLVRNKGDAAALHELIGEILKNQASEEEVFRYSSMSIWVPAATVVSGETTYVFEGARRTMLIVDVNTPDIFAEKWYNCTEEQMEAVIEIAGRYLPEE